MTELYVIVTQFTLRDLNDFVAQFRNDRVPLEELTLCRSIADRWRELAQAPGKPTATVDLRGSRQRLFLPRELADGRGVYAIFCCPNGGDRKPCFHVGMSTSSLKTRLDTRLRKNVRDNYAGAFGRLARYERLWACAAIIGNWRNNPANRRKLGLLEMCLAVYLRGWPYDE